MKKWFPTREPGCFIFYDDGTYVFHNSQFTQDRRPWTIIDGHVYFKCLDDELESWKQFFGFYPESISSSKRLAAIIHNQIFESEMLEVKVKKFTQLIASDANGLTVRQLKDAIRNLADDTLVTIGDGKSAFKIARTYITDDEGNTQVFLEIYDEKQ